MVQFFGTSENHKGKLAESLGLSLGQGIGNGLNTFFANRSLDSVLQDKSLADAPQSQKLEAIRSALSPYGEKGQEIFNQRLQIEQLEAQEKEQKKKASIEKTKGKALGKYLKGDALTPEEEALFTPKEFVDMYKAKNPNPAGGLGGQAVPPEVSKAIGEVLGNSKGKTADELKQDFDAAGIPPAYTNSYVENRREQNKSLYEPTEQKLEAERSSKLADEIVSEYEASRNEDMRLDRQEELIKGGGLSTPLMVKTLEFIGLPLGILNNPNSEEYAKLEADYVRDVSKVFPGAIKNFEIQSYLKTVPSLLNSPEGGKTIIRNRRLMNQAKKIRYDAYKDIIKQNGGIKPRNLDLLIDEKTAPRIAEIADQFKEGMQQAVNEQGPKVKMYDSNGRQYDIPQALINQAQKQGLIFK